MHPPGRGSIDFDSLLAAMDQGIEDASLFMQRIAVQLAQHGQTEASARMKDAASRARHRSAAIREMELEPDVTPVTAD